jgi:hypothetical protein
MTESYMDRVDREIRETMPRIQRDVASGLSPTDAINRNAHTTETYAHALKAYGLKPVIPD